MNDSDNNSAATSSGGGLEDAIRHLARSIDALNRNIHEMKGATAPARTAPPPEASADTPAAAPVVEPVHVPTPVQPPATPKAEAAPLRLGIVGTRGHGQKLISAFGALKQCQITHICDVDTKVSEETARTIKAKYGHQPAVVQDYRALLRQPDVDAVAIATPHHWHALMAIWALQAGKHVYLEKPVTHNLNEGPALLAAARKYGHVIQAGTQLRSNTSLAAAGEYMRAGRLGRIIGVHCLIHKNRPPMPLSDDNKIPASVDYDLWCGPAPKTRLTRSKFHYHWHWFWDYGNGALGNNGVHRIDAARIALDLRGLGDLVLSIGGRFGPRDNGETPNNQLTLHRFGDIWVLQDVLGLKPEPFRGIENGLLFYGTEGTIVYKSGKATLLDANGKPGSVFDGAQEDHHRNFVEAALTGSPDQARGDLQEAVISGDLCHLGNISYRLGQAADDTDITATLAGLKVPDFVQERMQAQRANLRKNGLQDRMVLGRVLRPAASGDPLGHDAEARALGRNSYRSPYTLPGPDTV